MIGMWYEICVSTSSTFLCPMSSNWFHLDSELDTNFQVDSKWFQVVPIRFGAYSKSGSTLLSTTRFDQIWSELVRSG